MADDVRRSTASFEAPTFEAEFSRWLKINGRLYYLDLTEAQVDMIVQHAARIARKRGMTK